MYEIVEGLRRALKIESTWVFASLVAALFAILGFGVGAIIHLGYKNSAEHRAEHSGENEFPKSQAATIQSLTQNQSQNKPKSSLAANKSRNTKSKNTAKPSIAVTQIGDTNVNQIGNNNQATINPEVNPNLPVITYDWNGIKHTQSPGFSKAEDGPSTQDFERIKDATKQEDWRTVVKLSEKSKTSYPQWLTPYYTAGVAYAYLCDTERAVGNLTTFTRQGKGSPQYDSQVGDAEGRLKALRTENSPCGK